MLKLNGLHLLLTYQCTFECEHCFAWGSPWQTGTMTIDTIRTILNQAKETASVEWIYFEGGEPFLYYQSMLAGIKNAIELGFKVGVVTNSYWAISEEDALLWLSPLAGKVQNLTISSDLFHFSEKVSQQSKYVTRAADQLNIPLSIICIEQPEIHGASSIGQIPSEATSIMYRGRAAEKLALKTSLYPSAVFSNCPHENLVDLEHARLKDLMLGADAGQTQSQRPVHRWWMTRAHLSGTLQRRDPFRNDPLGRSHYALLPDEDDRIDFYHLPEGSNPVPVANLWRVMAEGDLPKGPGIEAWAVPCYLDALQELAEAQGMELRNCALKYGTLDLPGRKPEQIWRYHWALGFSRYRG